jgi:hypothetical protein
MGQVCNCKERALIVSLCVSNCNDYYYSTLPVGILVIVYMIVHFMSRLEVAHESVSMVHMAAYLHLQERCILVKEKRVLCPVRGLPCPIANFALTEPLPKDIRSLLSVHTVPHLLPFFPPPPPPCYYFVNLCFRSTGTAVIVFTAWSGQFYVHPTLWDVCVCD